MIPSAGVRFGIVTDQNLPWPTLVERWRLFDQLGFDSAWDCDHFIQPSRPTGPYFEAWTLLAALAAVTDRLGLAGTINSTFNEPYEVARQFASLDHLSGGRAAWNVVTSWDAFTGENFRRGGYLAQGDRYERARTFLATANVSGRPTTSRS